MIVSRPVPSLARGTTVRVDALARHQRALRHDLAKTPGALLATLLLAWAGLAHAQPAVTPSPVAAQPAVPGPAQPLATEPPLVTPAPAPTSAAAQAPAGPSEASVPPASREAVLAALSRWGCQPLDLLEHQGRWYAACGSAGVLVVDRREVNVLVLGERRSVVGSAQALFVRASAVWVESTHIEAHPLRELSSAAAAPREPGPAPVRIAPGQLVTRPAVATRATYSKFAPPRLGKLWSVGGALRPYLPMRSLGVAMLADVAVTYRGERAWYLQAQIHPLGGTVTNGTDSGVFGGAASVGYDHQYFALGLGAGTLRRSELHSGFDDVQRRFREWTEHSFGLSVTQAARIGALDGINATLTNSFVLDDDRWRFGYFDLTVQVPINRQTWLTGAGGGAEQAGYIYAEVGLRRLVLGDRGAGSLFVRPSVGVAGLDNRVDGVGPGPMIGCHLEWRP